MWTLRVVGLLYLLSGLWCIGQDQLAAGFLGFDLASTTAHIEFLTVYGGLQVGIGLGCLVCSINPRNMAGALLFMVFVSAILVLARFYAFNVVSFEQALMPLFVLEIVLSIVVIVAYLKLRRQESV